MSAAPETWVRVGRIGKPFGLRGEVVIQYFGDTPARFAVGARLSVVTPDGRVPARVVSARQLSRKYVAAFAGRGTPETVRPWVGCFVEVPADELPVLEEGVYYHYQLLGLRVRRADGRSLGRVEEILTTASNDVYCVRGEGREVLVPAIEDAIERVDVEAGEIVLKDLEGLLEP